MKLNRLTLTALLLAFSGTVLSNSEPHAHNNIITMGTTTADWDMVKATPWAGGHVHGVPILNTTLTLGQQKYWKSYNTTTYLTLDSPYSPYVHLHLVLLFVSAFVFYPFVLVLNNLESNWFLPLLAVQASLSVVSCILYSVFINNVPDLYPNMAYTKMVTGWFVLTLLQALFAVVNSVRRWLPSNNSISGFQPFPTTDSSHYTDDVVNNSSLSNEAASTSIQLEDFFTPSSNLLANSMEGLNSSFNSDSSLRIPSGLDTDFSSALTTKVKSYSSLLGQTISRILYTLAFSFGSLFTILHNVTTWALLAYFFVLFPTGLSCLSLLGKERRVFNLLAHLIKGGIFFILGLVSLARYCGCFAGIAGAWNYAYVDLDSNKSQESSTVSETDRVMSGMGGTGSGGSNVSHSVWIRFHQALNSYENRGGGLICSFEAIESFLIFSMHLGSRDGSWSAMDLQHVSIAFMYFGAGLCGLVTELKLSSWRRSLFFNVAGKQLEIAENIKLDDDLTADEKLRIIGSKKMITPGFSPNPFPVFTIFWTGVLMSKHAQASALSSAIHVQWGSLLTYGSFFRVCTFLLMSYYPLHGSKECFLPSRPFTELVTSFCLLCGGMVFMESTDQVVEALAYRGLTPMFTLNVSVGIASLIMAWVMLIFAVKDRMRAEQLAK
ncbi:hypothetical protein PICMEDRAFT_178737 [Pichia membranifaciens NRRL Y-2026]|uniref:Protein YTP1-like C-terminal domain-containing protein n=1 Tax=Pichia membranifaciens NRRL Y-2026 TaxID=763406 RepID=A0A1E3NHS7_9ASCO|nr:hypothetical protein PICMEDRAFT_178737 [Pichia membranifaciens NRRL Y-2026]ODQ45692.1 hypothetical protein PICMEDRAFT_178737 [Pichia membranifaciens NRRL Y-2026]